MVIVLAPQTALTPAGKPLAPEAPLLEIPVAKVVVCVMGVKAVLIQSVGVEEAALAVMAAVTVMVPVALATPQPPESAML